MLRALAEGPARLGQRIVLLTRPGVKLPELPPEIRVARRRVPASALGRAVAEGAAVRAAAAELGCGCLLQESLPVPAVKGLAVVTTVHDLRPLHPELPGSSWLRVKLAPRLVRASFARSRALVAVSGFTRAEGVAFAPEFEPRWSVVPNAADHLPLHARPRRRDGGLVLFVGHLEERKGADVLLRAFVELARQVPESRLRFAGSGPLTASLRAGARAAGLSGRVAVEPARGDAELCQLYAEAALLAVPSRYEGFGIPVLEAARLGCPVVCARAAALPEVAGAAAAYVDGFEPAAWALQLRRLLADPAERDRLAAAGRARAAESSWERSARQLWSVVAPIVEA